MGKLPCMVTLVLASLFAPRDSAANPAPPFGIHVAQ